MTGVVLARHGESEWNARQILTGWSDPPLSRRGEDQARGGGARLAAHGVTIHRVYTSSLGRAGQTASIMLAAARAGPLTVEVDWRLNERHLGRLEGMTKAEVTAAWGNERRKRWRDDAFAVPPALDPADSRHPRHDRRYRDVPADRLPGSERWCDTARRVLEFWHERIVPQVRAGQRVMVVSHQGPLRILAHHLSWPADHPLPADWPHAEPFVTRLAAVPCCSRAPGADPR